MGVGDREPRTGQPIGKTGRILGVNCWVPFVNLRENFYTEDGVR